MDVLSKNSHKFQILQSSRDIECLQKSNARQFLSFFVVQFMKFVTALFLEVSKIRGAYNSKHIYEVMNV